jgi:hypothetical protein
LLKTIEEVLATEGQQLVSPGWGEALVVIRLSIDSELKALELRTQQSEIMRRAEALASAKIGSGRPSAAPPLPKSPNKAGRERHSSKSPEEAPKRKNPKTRSRSVSPGVIPRQPALKNLRDAAFKVVRRAGADAESSTDVDWLKPIRDCGSDVPMLQEIESVATEILKNPSRLSVGSSLALNRGEESLRTILSVVGELLNVQVSTARTPTDAVRGWREESGVVSFPG